MRRRSHTSGDSLELLLDAVTNAFGGILCLAILIIILVNQRSGRMRNPVEASQSSAVQQQVQVANLQSEVESLTHAIQEQEESLNKLKSESNADHYDRVIEMKQRISELEQERRKFILHNKELLQQFEQARLNQIQADLQVRDYENQKASLEEQLARLRLPQVRTTTTPRLRRTHKKEFPLILRYGRIYVPYSLDPSTGNKTFNEQEFILIEDAIDATRVTPKPYRGVAVEDTAELALRLTASLMDIDGDEYYIAIAAWSDSFTEFNELRNAVVNLGYEYRIIPVETGGFIQEGSIRESLVQ